MNKDFIKETFDPKALTIEELKAKAYDIARVNRRNMQNLQALDEEISRREAEEVKANGQHATT